MNIKEQHLAEEKLAFVIGLAEEWKAKFDNKPDISFNFTVHDGELRMNGEKLCPVELIDTDASFCDPECIILELTTLDAVSINIIWPHIGPITTHIELIPGGQNLEYRAD